MTIIQAKKLLGKRNTWQLRSIIESISKMKSADELQQLRLQAARILISQRG